MGTKFTIKQKIGRYIIPKLPISKDLFSVLRSEFKTLRLRIANIFNIQKYFFIKKIQNQDSILVNIGAGPFGETGWINIDISRLRNISFTYDCRRKLPFRDSTVSKIRCEHFLEHLYFIDEVPIFLKQCYRVLKPGGLLRIVVPDGEKILRAYFSGEWNAIGINPSNWLTPMDAVNFVFHQNGEHKFCYDFLTLETVLKAAGFSTIMKQAYSKSLDKALEKDLENHRLYSLYVDCIK